jgi:hypothetical protein
MYHALPILGLLAILALAAAYRKKDKIAFTGSYDKNRSLRKTIAVNLSILLPELDELESIAVHASPTAAVEEAQKLLRLARESTVSIDSDLKMASSTKELGDILETVFAAMTGSSTARRLLGACHPID